MILMFLDSAQSAESTKNNLCVSTNKISPDSWCKKSESKGAVVPPADFLLESDKRGTPPKSEKRQLLARRGSGEGGAALLREKTSKIDDKGLVESSADSTNQNEFIISYRAIMKDNILIGEEFKVAKALTITQNPRIMETCDIESNANDSHIKTLRLNKNAILSCFERTLNNKIRDDIKSINNEVRVKTTYKIPAQRILLDRKDGKIHIIGQK